MQVNLIGSATCGKPYGFASQDNCNTTYFAIQFQGVNAHGFGDYPDGFTPTCQASDDFSHALGEPWENVLAAALAMRTSGACVVHSFSNALALSLGQQLPELLEPAGPFVDRSKPAGVKAIQALLTGLSVPHQTDLTEYAQVFGGPRLGHPELQGQLGHRLLTSPKK